MPRTAAPLIARLRRRLAMSVWLFAFLVLAKSAVAASCITDGFSAASAATAVSVAAEAPHDDVVNDGDEAPCWHGGAAGCHCSCAHGVALPAGDVQVSRTAVPSSAPLFSRTPFVSSPGRTELRPPIA